MRRAPGERSSLAAADLGIPPVVLALLGAGVGDEELPTRKSEMRRASGPRPSRGADPAGEVADMEAHVYVEAEAAAARVVEEMSLLQSCRGAVEVDAEELPTRKS